MEQKLVSVIMPIYNVEEYLDKSINSILTQSLKDFELILVDDGSKDNSPQIIEDFKKKDKRIVTIHQKNAGADAARNTGIEYASGKYVSFIDSDDYIAEDFLEKLVCGMEQDDCQLSVCRFETFGVSNPPKVLLLDGAVIDQAEAITHCLGYNSFNGYVWNKLFSLKIINDNNLRFEAGYFPNEDVLFVGKYISYCKKIAILPDVLYFYRQNNTGGNRGRYSGKTKFDKKWLNSLRATKTLESFYNNDNVTNACRLHDVREAGIVLRSMAAGKYNGEEYKKLKRFVRKNAHLFYKSKEASRTQKMSVWLTTISPSLELIVWKMVNKSW